MIFLLAFLILAEPVQETSSPRNDAELQDLLTPCETIPYFASNGSFAIGGIPFKKADIEKVESVFDEYTGAPAITILLSGAGQAKFRKAQEIAIGQPIPICLDNKTILNPILVEFIQGNEVYLSGGFSADEASALISKILNALYNPAMGEN